VLPCDEGTKDMKSILPGSAHTTYLHAMRDLAVNSLEGTSSKTGGKITPRLEGPNLGRAQREMLFIDVDDAAGRVAFSMADGDIIIMDCFPDSSC
jgi:hypothetical protein